MKQHKRQFLSKHDRYAVIAGTKTQMRLVLDPQPIECEAGTELLSFQNGLAKFGVGDVINCKLQSPFGQPGSWLWVPEPWKIGAWNEYVGQLAIDYLDGPLKEWITVPEDPDDYHGGSVFNRYWMESTEDAIASGRVAVEGKFQWEPGQSPCRWRSLFSMPWWASRIWLEIVSVRVERLQDISREDAWAEGCDQQLASQLGLGGTEPGQENFIYGGYARKTFTALWESINGPGSWEANPWVWAIEFKRITPQTP